MDEIDREFEQDQTEESAAGENDVTPASETEADVLRSELEAAQEKIEVLRQTSDDFKDKFLRSRAELDNYRRRSVAELERARASGLDSAIAAVLRVFDDLERALQVSGEGMETPITEGVQLVLENLEADLGRLGVERLGAPGEKFNPEQHEALTSLPVEEGHEPGTIAQVVTVGFSQGSRLIRPASVVVYND